LQKAPLFIAGVGKSTFCIANAWRGILRRGVDEEKNGSERMRSAKPIALRCCNITVMHHSWAQQEMLLCHAQNVKKK
jgi:hypothetical protein